MMKKSLALMGLMTVSVGAFAQYFEDFESYATGPLLTGGWGGWDNVNANAGDVSTTQAYGGTKSIRIHTNGSTTFNDYTDAVRPWTGFSTGKWIVTVRQYLPTGCTVGSTPYFILMNKYDGTAVGYEWTVQHNARGTDNVFQSDELPDASETLPPLVFDAWKPIHVYVDLDKVVAGVERGEQRNWYNWTRLENAAYLTANPDGQPWRQARNATSTQPTEIQNVDLFYNPAGGGPVEFFYDNLSIRANTTTYAASAVSTVEGFEVGGDVASLLSSDDNAYSAFPDEVSLRCVVQIEGNNDLPSVAGVTFNMEHSVGRPGLAYAVNMFNYTTNAYVNKGGGVAPIADAGHSSVVTTGANDYSSNGAMKTQVVYNPINDEDPAQDGWPHMIDQANWSVTAF